MGVRRLETFLHEHPQCIHPVNIEELALAYRAKYNRTPELMIDANTCLRFILNKKSWLSGYQMNVIAHTFEMFLKKIQSTGIEITCFIGGLVYSAKVENWIRNQKDKMDAVKKIYNMIRSNQREIPKIEHQKMFSASFKKVIIDCFEKLGCQVFQSRTGCTPEAAMYAKRNKYFGVLAQESDYVIHNCADYYFSMKDLDLNTLNTICYRTDKLAELLGLSQRQLPLLATAMGNRIVNCGSLRRFHKTLFKENEKFSRNDTFFKVANFLKENVTSNQSLNSQLPGLSKIIFRTVNKSYYLKNSLKSYNIFLSEKITIDYFDDPKWVEFLRLATQLHKAAKLPHTIYQIVSEFNYYNRVDMTDPDKTSNQIGFEIAQQLRRKIYGILLINKAKPRGIPVSVKEVYIDTNKEMQENYAEPIYPEMEVDLFKLWLDVDCIYNEDKWNLFCSSLKIQRDMLPADVLHLIIPIASLKYLSINGFEIAAWEFEAVLASMLLLQYYSVEDLEAIPEFPLDLDGINLYWYLMKIFDLLVLLNSVCGFPLDSNFASPVHYQDGKLFHQKYRQAKENESFESLYEFRDQEIKLGKKIKTMIHE